MNSHTEVEVIGVGQMILELEIQRQSRKTA